MPKLALLSTQYCLLVCNRFMAVIVDKLYTTLFITLWKYNIENGIKCIYMHTFMYACLFYWFSFILMHLTEN